MRQICVALLLAGWLVCGVPGANAAPIAVNGFLDDWIAGAPPSGSLTGAYDLPAGTLVPTRPNVTYWIEDSVGDGGYVGPGVGGQNYDVEAAYGILTPGTFYGAFVTGFDKGGQYGWGGNPYYRTGDLFFDLNSGPAGTDPTWDLAIALTDHDGLTAGNVYVAPGGGGDWYSYPTDYHSSAPALLKDKARDATSQFTVHYGYHEGVLGELSWASTDTTKYSGSDHNVYEVSLSGSMLSDVSSIRMHYTQECGNDLFDLDMGVVPEPGLSVLALGAFVAGAFARYRKRKASAEVA